MKSYGLLWTSALLFASTEARAADKISCVVETQQGCSTQEVCMNWDVSETRCLPIDKAPDLDLILPFDNKTEVVCTHARGVGSHSWGNAFWSLDLASPYETAPAQVRASASGTAFVFGGEDGKPCLNPPGKPAKAEIQKCGRGWGNHVKVLHQDGYFSFYVHLEKVTVRDGQKVEQGDPLGLEGWTGQAGHRHLHWSLQKIGGATDRERIENLKKWDGLSAPFRFRAQLNNASTLIDVSTFDCPHAAIGGAPNQPRLRGSLP